MTWGQFHPFQAPIQGSRGPKMPILWLEQDQNGWAAPGWTSPPGKCLLRHITPQCMREHGLGPLLSFPGTYQGFQGSKNSYFMASENAYFMARTRLKWLGCSRLDWPTWKVSTAPYHTPMHGRPISTFPGTYPGVQDVLHISELFWPVNYVDL